jgi:DNA-binding response OmpR family regulator
MREIDSCLVERRILIVEDEAMIAMLIQDILESAGARVIGLAATVNDALQVIEQQRPDAVTLDGNLNDEMSGPIAARLKELNVPYLVVTGYVQRALADADLAGAPQLEKPFTASTLLKAATAHLC